MKISRRQAAAVIAGGLGVALALQVLASPPWIGRGSPWRFLLEAAGGDGFVLRLALGLLLCAGGLAAAAWLTRRTTTATPETAVDVWLPAVSGPALALAAVLLDPWWYHSTALVLASCGFGLGACASLRRRLELDSAESRLPAGTPALLIGAVGYVVLFVGVSPLTPEWHKLLGDEPHYLLMAHSALVDGDMELSANYNDEDYYSFFPAHNLPPHTKPGLIEGLRYSIHGWGLGFLLMPLYAIARPFDVATFTFLIRAGQALWLVLFAYVLFALLEDIVGRRGAIAGTAAAVLSGPILFNAPHLFPDLPGMTLCASAYLLLRRRRDLLGLLAAGFCLAWLPWLHFKMLGLFATMVGVGVAWQLWPRLHPDPEGRRGEAIGDGRWCAAASVAALPVLAVLLQMLYTWSAYGRLSPMSITVGVGMESARQIVLGSDLRAYLMQPGAALRTALGYLMDQKEGLLFHAPHYVLAAAGAAWLWKRRLRELAALTLIFLSYFGPIALSQVAGNWSPPQRWMVAGLWVLAVLGGIGVVLPHARGQRAEGGTLTRGAARGLRLTRGALLGATGVITFLFLGTPNLMFNDIGVTRSLLAQTYGGPGIDLWRGLPLWFRFEEPQWGVTIAWLVVVVQLAAMVWIWAVRSQGDESAENPVSTTAAAVVIVIATALLLLHHARIPVPSEGIRTTREYGPVRVQATTRPPTRIWPQPSLIWFGGNDDVTVALSSQRPLESIEARLTVLDDMTAEIQLGAHRSEQTLRGGENRRIVLRPGPGVRWRGWYYYPLRVRSDDAVPAVELVGNPNDTRNLGVGVRLGAPQFAPR